MLSLYLKEAFTMQEILSGFNQLLSMIGLEQYASSIFLILVLLIIWRIAKPLLMRIFSMIGFCAVVYFIAPNVFYTGVDIVRQLVGIVFGMIG